MAQILLKVQILVCQNAMQCFLRSTTRVHWSPFLSMIFQRVFALRAIPFLFADDTIHMTNQLQETLKSYQSGAVTLIFFSTKLILAIHLQFWPRASTLQTKHCTKILVLLLLTTPNGQDMH